MQQHKRGNPRRRARKRTNHPVIIAQPLESVRLTLHEADPITGREDTLYTLFYESTEVTRSTAMNTGDAACMAKMDAYVSRAGMPLSPMSSKRRT